MKKSIKLFLLFLLLTALETAFLGCTKMKNTDIIYNSACKRFEENVNGIFYFNSDSTGGNKITFCDKRTGTSGVLIKNLFQDDIMISDGMFAEGDNIYYMYFTKDYSERGLYEGNDKFIILKVDTTDYNEKVIYEANANPGKKDFMGMPQKDKNTDFYMGITGFFLDEKYFYFIYNNQIWEMNRLTGKKMSIIEAAVMRNVAYDGKNIYYINDLLQLIKYNTESRKSEAISDIITEYFILDYSKLYYINRRDNYTIYSYDLADGSITKISNHPASSFICGDQYIFYIDRQTSYPHRINVNGGNDRIVLEKEAFSIYLFRDYDKIYINLVSDNNREVILNKNTLEEEEDGCQ